MKHIRLSLVSLVLALNAIVTLYAIMNRRLEQHERNAGMPSPRGHFILSNTMLSVHQKRGRTKHEDSSRQLQRPVVLEL